MSHQLNGSGLAVPDLNGSSTLENVPGKPPLVSVVIPAYQCAEYIAHGIESVLAQSLRDFEVIVVNDGSPDTPQLESALQPYQSKITYVRQANSGPSSARNAGLQQARGKYVAFLDGDDYWSPDHLAKSVGLLEQNPGVALVYCDCTLVKGDQPYTSVFLVQPQSSRVSFESLLLQSSTISTSCVVASREAVLAAGGFDESLRRCEDFDLWLRLCFTGGRMAYHPHAEVFHRVHDESLSADSLAMIKDRVLVYQKTASALPISNDQRRIIHRMITKSESDGYIEQLKLALEAKDYDKARNAAAHAHQVEPTWKIRFAMLGLQIAPRTFRGIHRFRSAILQRREHSRRAPLSREREAAP